MARKSSKKKSLSKSKKKQAFNRLSWIENVEFDRNRYMRIGVVVICLVVVGSIIAGWIYSIPRLRDYSGKALATDSIKVNFLNQPVWMKEQPKIIATLRNTVTTRVGVNPLKRENLESAYLALMESGWFSKIKKLQRIKPDEIEITATYVKPFTTIQDTNNTKHLVAEDAIMLPFEYPSNARLKMPSIINPHFALPDKPGQKWEGKDIEAGLLLARKLVGKPWVNQIAAIDVSEYMDTETLWLVSDRGARIFWGRSPGDERGREVPASQKLSYLDYFYEECGRVEGSQGYEEIDLALDVVYAR